MNRRPTFRLSLREQIGHGITEEQVWATRQESFNPGRLRQDEYVQGFRFLVAYEKNCANGKCQVWTETFSDYSAAKRFLTAQGEIGQSASMFSILPADMVRA